MQPFQTPLHYELAPRIGNIFDRTRSAPCTIDTHHPSRYRLAEAKSLLILSSFLAHHLTIKCDRLSARYGYERAPAFQSEHRNSEDIGSAASFALQNAQTWDLKRLYGLQPHRAKEAGFEIRHHRFRCRWSDRL